MRPDRRTVVGSRRRGRPSRCAALDEVVELVGAPYGNAQTIEHLDQLGGQTRDGRRLLERDLAGPAYVDCDLVFADALGGPLSPRRLTGLFAMHRRAAGIPTGTLHTLRHTAATLALTSGVPVHIVAARLGDRPEQILTTYAHLLPQSDELAAERIAEVLA